MTYHNPSHSIQTDAVTPNLGSSLLLNSVYTGFEGSAPCVCGRWALCLQTQVRGRVLDWT